MGKRGRKPEDLTGNKYVKLTVERMIEVPEQRGAHALCKCDCGNETVVLVGNLKRGNTKSCGCLANGHRKRAPRKNVEIKTEPSGNIQNLTGQRFGRLTVTSFAGTRNGRAMYECRCDCGKTITVRRNSLTSGNTKSCGCLIVQTNKKNFTKTGDASKDSPYHRLYHIWKLMLDRCENPASASYRYSGAFGVKICEEWHDWTTFRDWGISHGWKPV